MLTPTSIHYLKSKGNSFVNARVRNPSNGEYLIFLSGLFQATNDATTKSYLTEYPTSDIYESLYSGNIDIPVSDYILELYAQDSLIGSSSTYMPASQASVTAIPSVADISLALTTDHGVGSWVDTGATSLVGIAKTSDIVTSQSALDSRISAIPTNPLLTNDVRLNHLDANISNMLQASSYVSPDNSTVQAIAGYTDTLESTLATLISRVPSQVSSNSDMATILGRLTYTRAGYLDNLVKLDRAITAIPSTSLTGIALTSDVMSAKDTIVGALPPAPDNTSIQAINSRLPISPASVSDVNITVNPTLTSSEHSQLMAIPLSTVLSNDLRLDNLDAKISSRISSSEILTEAYAAKGDNPTLSEILFMIWGMLSEKAKTGSTIISTKRLDDGSVSMNFSLDNEKIPTSITRVS